MIRATPNAPSKPIFAAAPARPAELGWPIGLSVKAHDAPLRAFSKAAISSMIASNRLEAGPAVSVRNL
jgi:hypothetical protein